MKKHYCVWGVDKSYRWLWQAALVAGYIAFKNRWNENKKGA